MSILSRSNIDLDVNRMVFLILQWLIEHRNQGMEYTFVHTWYSYLRWAEGTIHHECAHKASFITEVITTGCVHDASIRLHVL